MGAQPAKKQAPPQRATRQYTEGTGFFTPPTPTVATQPLLGKTGSVPAYPYVWALDQDESTNLSVGALGAGASATITGMVSFPDIPVLKLDPTDRATLIIEINAYQNPIVAGLVIASVQISPQALQQATGQWVPAQTLLGGQVYTSWRALVTLGVTAVVATGAATITVGGPARVMIISQ